MLKILLIEDEKINRITLEKLLVHAGYQVEAVATGTLGLEAVRKDAWDVVITDLRLPGANGLEILDEVKRLAPETQVLIMTAYATVENALSALKKGAFDYLTKPFDPQELFHHLEGIQGIRALNAENAALKASLAELQGATPDFIGESPLMRSLLEKVKMVAGSEHTVLIEGASGTGKEKIANAIQQYSPRREQPFIKINCSALSESLFETEMFGHEKGAFTGAVKRSLGRFERARGGTIFLDDIDDLSLKLQTKLLRVIQEGEIERVGGSEIIPVDVRIIAATKVDLKSLLATQQFREDLYYRLNVIKLRLPPLKDRPEDIPLLARYFLNKTNPEQELAPELLLHLSRLDWPGNVRELEHVVLQMSVFARNQVLAMDDLPEAYRLPESSESPEIPASGDLTSQVEAFEKRILQSTLQQLNNNQQQVADRLGIPRTTLRSKLLKYGLLDTSA